MTKNEVVGAMNQEATINPVFKDFALLCAHRQRARKNLTLQSLSRKMKAEGFKYQDKELEAIFKKLSHWGLGTIDLAPNGKIRALKDIKVTLQSIGSAALGSGKKDLTGFRPRAKFGKIFEMPPLSPRSVPKPQVIVGGGVSRVTLTVMLGDKAINIPVPAELSAAETAALIGKFQK